MDNKSKSQTEHVPDEDMADYFCDTLPSDPQPQLGKILVTGATGYVGGRLVRELTKRGYQVRVMVRRESPEQTCLWPDSEIVVGDALDKNALLRALEGIYCAYYLIHSLTLGPEEFAAKDLQSACNFRAAAEDMNVKRIIYLGGLGLEGGQGVLSDHLQSRTEVALELSKGNVPATILRAAIIIGSGSAPYEIIQNLIKNLPIILTPSGTNTLCQPIGIRDVVKYLVGVLEKPETSGRTFDIGSDDRLTYKNMLRIMAEVFELKRMFVPVPVFNIPFYAYVASQVTPVPAELIRCLFLSLRNEVICHDNSIREILPFTPLSYRESIVRAIARERRDRVYTRWSDHYPVAHETHPRLHELSPPPQYTSSYAIDTPKKPGSLYHSFCRIGGKEGWFHNNWMWRLRGMIDKLFLGVGSTRGRRSTATLKTNDVIDFWRVEDLQPSRRLLLRAEMKLPGKAWLEFLVEEMDVNSRFFINAYYETKSVWGHIYWYVFLPFHFMIFKNLLKQIEKRSG